MGPNDQSINEVDAIKRLSSPFTSPYTYTCNGNELVALCVNFAHFKRWILRLIDIHALLGPVACFYSLPTMV